MEKISWARHVRSAEALNLLFVVPYILVTYVLFKSNWMYILYIQLDLSRTKQKHYLESRSRGISYTK
jgi:hypothetical protein